MFILFSEIMLITGLIFCVIQIIYFGIWYKFIIGDILKDNWKISEIFFPKVLSHLHKEHSIDEAHNP